MGLGNFIFNTAVSVGVGVAVTALVAGTGPLGIAAAVAVKGAEASVGLYAVGTGVLAAGYTNVCLSQNSGRSSFGGSYGISSGRGSSGGSSSGTNNSNNQRSKSNASGSGNSNSGGNTSGSNDPYRDPNKRDSSNSDDSEDSNSTDQDDEDWDSSDERDERNHRYKYIAKRYPGRSKFAQPLEIDHTIPMAVWKELLKEIKKYTERDLPKHLKRALKIFRIILKNKDIFSLSTKDLDKLMKEFPAIEILKVIHRHQFSTGNKELQKKFNKLILDFILAGNWDKAIEYIFKDQYQIAKHLKVGQVEIENILNRQRSFIKYLLRKGILTNDEARKLIDVINSLS